MKTYIYNISEPSLAERKRYSKDHLRVGEILAYCQTTESWSSLYGSTTHTQTGLIEIEAYDSIPYDMRIYQATDYEIALVMGTKLNEDYTHAKSARDIDIVPYLMERIEIPGKERDAFKEQLFSLPIIIDAENSTTFKKDVWNACKDKIGAVGLNFDKEKTELYTILIAEAMIIGTDKDPDEGLTLSSLLHRHWFEFSIIYSLFYGRNIATGHQRFVELLSYLLSKKDSDRFMKLMLIALGEPQQKIAKIMRYSPAENYQKLYEKIVMMQKQKDLVAQDTKLDELFQILFPSTFKQYLDNDNPIASIEEMQAQIRESKFVKEILHKVEMYAESLKKDLGNAISIQALREAFARLETGTARAIFAQLDFVLEGENEVWDKHRLLLKQDISNRCKQEALTCEDTHKQALLAADYAKQAATRPKQITNHFEKDSVRFEAGSTMNGDVIKGES